MTKPNTTYRKLGEYIEPIDERNKDLSINNSLGISNDKYFQKPRQVADKPETHKIVRNGYFAYNRATTRNGEKISIALREGPDCTVSSAYQIFRVKDENILDSKYLMMWFRRPEFDRYARYMSHGSAHEFFEYEQMCDVLIPYIPITEQRAVVAEYEAVQRRIDVAKRTIATLQDTAQTLYRKTFVDGIDKENLPEGWRWGTLGEVCECFDSKRKPLASYDRCNMEKKYPYYGAACLMDYVSDYLFDGCYILMGEDGTVIKDDNTPILQYVTGKFWVNNHAHVLKGINGFDENLLYMVLSNTNIAQIVTGGVQAKINQANMMSIGVLIPKPIVLNTIKEQLAPLFQNIILFKKEIEKLTEIQTIMLSGMGR